MYVLSSLEDNVPVAPPDLARPLLDAVADALRRRHLDRVVPGLGLAVALYALDAVVGGAPSSSSHPPPGAAYYTARFRLAFFRPFAGEVIVGTLVEATRWGGLRVAIGAAGLAAGAAAGAAAGGAARLSASCHLDAVFRDILVRPTDLPPNSSWDPQERTWVWSYPDETGAGAGAGGEGDGEEDSGAAADAAAAPPTTPFVMDVGRPIRVRVLGVRYPAPPTPAERRMAQQAYLQQQQGGQQQQQQGGSGSASASTSAADAEVAPPVGSAANPYAPMEVLASANGDGLGMVEWWTPEEEEEEEDGEGKEAQMMVEG